jgi:hypothetical protein
MKKIIVGMLLSAGLVASTFAQGVVVFKNFGGGSNVPGGGNLTPVPLVYGTDGTTRLDGTGFTAQLWDANSMTALTPGSGTGVVGFGTGNFAGTFAPNNSIAVPGVAAGSDASLMVRVWDNQGGTVTSFDSAAIRGESVTFSVTLADAQSPTFPILAGMNSFSLAAVPEPSVIALAVVGIGAFLVRRKK